MIYASLTELSRELKNGIEILVEDVFLFCFVFFKVMDQNNVLINNSSTAWLT